VKRGFVTSAQPQEVKEIPGIFEAKGKLKTAVATSTSSTK
jgi:hypothetical protein